VRRQCDQRRSRPSTDLRDLKTLRATDVSTAAAGPNHLRGMGIDQLSLKSHFVDERLSERGNATDIMRISSRLPA
jgi:hypothetical protein